MPRIQAPSTEASQAGSNLADFRPWVEGSQISILLIPEADKMTINRWNIFFVLWLLNYASMETNSFATALWAQLRNNSLSTGGSHENTATSGLIHRNSPSTVGIPNLTPWHLSTAATLWRLFDVIRSLTQQYVNEDILHHTLSVTNCRLHGVGMHASMHPVRLRSGSKGKLFETVVIVDLNGGEWWNKKFNSSNRQRMKSITLIYPVDF